MATNQTISLFEFATVILFLSLLPMSTARMTTLLRDCLILSAHVCLCVFVFETGRGREGVCVRVNGCVGEWVSVCIHIREKERERERGRKIAINKICLP